MDSWLKPIELTLDIVTGCIIGVTSSRISPMAIATYGEQKVRASHISLMLAFVVLTAAIRALGSSPPGNLGLVVFSAMSIVYFAVSSAAINAMFHLVKLSKPAVPDTRDTYTLVAGFNLIAIAFLFAILFGENLVATQWDTDIVLLTAKTISIGATFSISLYRSNWKQYNPLKIGVVLATLSGLCYVYIDFVVFN